MLASGSFVTGFCASPGANVVVVVVIRACGRLAALLDGPLIQAAQNVAPGAVTSQESVQRLRSWATGRCLDAERGRIYANSQHQRILVFYG